MSTVGDRAIWREPDLPRISQCAVCRSKAGDATCAAFPDGIPEAILRNEVSHAKPVEWDNGIRLEPIEVPQFLFERITRLEWPSYAVAYDVLEHIPDHDSAVAQVRRTLAPDGSFLIAVPCDPRLWSAHDVAVDHVRRYTKATLTDLLLRGGFTIERLWSWNVLLRPAVRLRRRRSAGSDLDTVHPVVNLALRGVVTLERHLPVKALPGVTLMVTARPSR